MDKEAFWRIIETSRAELSEEPMDAEYMRRRLLEMSQQDIESFFTHYEDTLLDLKTHNVYLLGSVLNGDTLSGDGFKYFRGWLVLMGRDAVALALSDPDAISENVELARKLANDQVEYESFCYFIDDAYEQKFGASIYDSVPPPLELDDKTIGFISFDEAAKRLPKLTKIINDMRNSSENQ